ncbi:MAG TPA: hypothetical protein PKD00_10540 [Burkholderiales bacterium]|nr:hypothetical protein [Burkholderiales bacterium]
MEQDVKKLALIGKFDDGTCRQLITDEDTLKMLFNLIIKLGSGVQISNIALNVDIQ